MEPYRPWVDGAFLDGLPIRALTSPWDGAVVGHVAEGGVAEVERALAAALAARPLGRGLSAAKRRGFCQAIADGIARHAEVLAARIRDEAGKPIRLARGEVARARATFAFAAAEVTRFAGEVVPIDLDDAAEGYEAFVRRVPAGVVAAISPFNFPLNLGAHKVAPALAVGAPVIWKPPPQAPGAAALVAEIAREAGVPGGLFQVLPCGNEAAERLATDPRVAVLSFTGSVAVGWKLKARSGRAKVTLELGGNAAAIVCADADLDHAAARCALGGMVYAGQVCISVQRVLVERSAYAGFRERLLAAVATIRAGDPRDPEVLVGPVIDLGHARRIEGWIEEARARGATVHGGARSGTVIEPAVLEDVPPDAAISCEEVFGPVVILAPFDDFDGAIAAANDSRFGLQAGVFTRDLGRVRKAWRELEVGGVVANDYPTFRADNAPYGGVKESGLGREGLRWAMEDYTEPRVLVLGGLV